MTIHTSRVNWDGCVYVSSVRTKHQLLVVIYSPEGRTQKPWVSINMCGTEVVAIKYRVK